jgi:hypothetical protein
MMWLRSLAVWFLIIFAESIHGTLRELLLTQRVGDAAARRIAIFTGMTIILAITLLTIRWIGAVRPSQLLAIGITWSALTILFEAVLGVLVFGYTADRLLAEFDVRRGGLMGFGILFMTFVPLIAAIVRRVDEQEQVKKADGTK